MNGNGSSADRQVEVQLEKRQGEPAPAPASDVPGGAYLAGDPWPHSTAIVQTSGSDPHCDLPVGEAERIASAATILDALERALVVSKMVKNRAVPTGPNRTPGF